MSLLQTPSQTVGPYFAYGLTPEQYLYASQSLATGQLATEATPGELITVEGRVLDGEGQPISDAMIEIWQANAEGRYQSPDFGGFGRFGTGTETGNRFVFQTIKPGRIRNDATHAPHLTMIIFMRGLLSHLYTRLYFSDEAAANEQDEVLNSLPPARRPTLIAQRSEQKGRVTYTFDIRVQGEGETVFFDV